MSLCALIGPPSPPTTVSRWFDFFLLSICTHSSSTGCFPIVTRLCKDRGLKSPCDCYIFSLMVMCMFNGSISSMMFVSTRRKYKRSKCLGVSSARSQCIFSGSVLHFVFRTSHFAVFVFKCKISSWLPEPTEKRINRAMM